MLPPPSPEAPTPAKPPNPALVIITLVSVAGLLLLMPATFVFLLIAMAPTIIVTLRDRMRDQLRVQTMASMNMAGTLPILVMLWTKGNTFDNALSLILRPSSLILIYGAASLGGLLLWFGPVMAARALTFINKREALNLKRKNVDLRETWGEQIDEDAANFRGGGDID